MTRPWFIPDIKPGSIDSRPGTAGGPEPGIVKCPNCHAIEEVRVRSSKPGSTERTSFLECGSCQHAWKVQGKLLRGLLLAPL